MEKTTGQRAYEAYGDIRHWHTFNGDPMPNWGEQSSELQEAWETVARAAINAAADEPGDASSGVQFS